MESLKEIDRFFDENVKGGNPVAGGLLSDDFGTRMFSIGAYVGEVMRREGGGTWKGDDNDPEGELNLSIRFYKTDIGSLPIKQVLKRFNDDDELTMYEYATMTLKVNKRMLEVSTP